MRDFVFHLQSSWLGMTYLCNKQIDPTLAPKTWLNHGLPGCKPDLTNQNFLIVKPGFPDFTICAKSLVNQGIPGKSGKPGYSKNQEINEPDFNQALKVLNEPGLPDFTICAKSLVNQGIPGKLGKPAWLLFKTRKTRLKPDSWNLEWTRLTRLEPYLQKA